MEWVVDHPGLFFGSLAAALIGYIAHGSIGGNQREKAVAEVERASPVSPREVADVGRLNAVGRAAFEAAVERVVAACPGGSATPAEVSFALREQLGRVGGGDLAGEHHLRRAARVLAAAAAAVGDAAAVAGEAVAVAGDVAAAAPEGGAAQVPRSGSSAEAPRGDGALPDLYDGADVEVPLLPLLSLYGATVRGRLEGPVEAGSAESDFPSPSERLDLWLALMRRAGAGAAADAPPGGMVALSELERLAALLAQTWQLPARARVHQVGTWPYPTHALRSDAASHIADALAEAKLDEARAKAAEERAKAGAAPVPEGHFVDAATLALCPASRGTPSGGAERLFSRAEAVQLMLRSRAVCAWNECQRGDERRH